MSFAEDEEPEKVQFPIRFLFAAITFIALLLGVFAIAVRARSDKRQLQTRQAELQVALDLANVELRNLKGDAIRTAFSERILLHVLGHSDEYPAIVSALKNYEQRNIGVSLHGLDDDDNLTYLNIYPVQSSGQPPFCHSFLVHEEPFEVLDYIQGEQSRYPRKLEDRWVCGAGQNGLDRWFAIEGKRFQLLDDADQTAQRP